MDGFLEVVKEAWVCDPDITDPLMRLDIMLRNTARALATWGQKEIGNIKLQIATAYIVILRFDCAQESRALTEEEIWLRRMLKQLVLGLASLETQTRSYSTWLQTGDS